MIISEGYQAFRSQLSELLLFFFRFAWNSRFKLPYILSSAFMIFDVRVQIDIQLF